MNKSFTSQTFVSDMDVYLWSDFVTEMDGLLVDFVREMDGLLGK